MKKSLIATVALLGVVTLGGCSATGVTHLGDGKVAVSRSLTWPIPVPLKPVIYDCSGSGGTCSRIK